MDEFQLQIATDPQISPDGKKIVYVRRFADPMTDRRYSNLWIVNADGTDHRPLTTGNRNDASPRWSPDGARLAYLSDTDGKQQIYVRWMDTRTNRAHHQSRSSSRRHRMVSRRKNALFLRRSFSAKVRTSPISRSLLREQSGLIPPPPTIASSIASTAPAI